MSEIFIFYVGSFVKKFRLQFKLQCELLEMILFCWVENSSRTYRVHAFLSLSFIQPACMVPDKTEAAMGYDLSIPDMGKLTVL